MSVPGDGLRDKRPTFLKVYTTEYKHFGTIPKGVRAYAMAVYLCLASHANEKRDDAVWPAHATICEQTGLSKPTVIKALDALARSGHISIEPRAVKGFHTSNLYTLEMIGVNVADTAREAKDAEVNDVDTGGQPRLRRGSATLTTGVNDVDTNQIKESDQLNEKKEGEDTAASGGARGARPSPLPPAVYDFPQMKRDPAEISAELRAEWEKVRPRAR